MDWFTFFFTLNLAALTWIFAIEKPTSSSAQKLVSGTFIVFNITAALNAIFILTVFKEYDHSTASTVLSLLDVAKSNTDEYSSVYRELHSSFASGSAFDFYRYFALIAHFLSFLLIAWVWFYLAFKVNVKPKSDEKTNSALKQ